MFRIPVFPLECFCIIITSSYMICLKIMLELLTSDFRLLDISLLKRFNWFFEGLQSTLFRVNFVIYYITMNLHIKLNSLHQTIFSSNYFSLNFVILRCLFGHFQRKKFTLEDCICKVFKPNIYETSNFLHTN